MTKIVIRIHARTAAMMTEANKYSGCRSLRMSLIIAGYRGIVLARYTKLHFQHSEKSSILAFNVNISFPYRVTGHLQHSTWIPRQQ
jgi:hypothetical protein